jgi:hypothetical protein
MEGTYLRYVNWFRTEPLAQSKQQKSEERDKRRQLSYKFNMSSSAGGDFAWHGPLYGGVSSASSCLEALRHALLSLEADISAPFLHSEWRSHGHSERWARAVRLCSTPQDFGTALSILVACVKPIVISNVWRDAIGMNISFFFLALAVCFVYVNKT